MPSLSINYLIFKKDDNENEQSFQQVIAANLKINILKTKHIPAHTTTQNISKWFIELKKNHKIIK